jgi:lysophospholipase L1-like esterase
MRKTYNCFVSFVLSMSICAVMCGCVGTVAPTPWGRAYRLAIAYPFAVESMRMTATNGTFELCKYASEGANSNTVALAQALAAGVTEGVAASVSKSRPAPELVAGSTPRDVPGLTNAPPRHILVVGDSWAAGHVAETGKDDGWPKMMGIAPELRQGVDGTTAASWSRDDGGCLTRALATPCDCIIVSLLGNDAFAAWGDKNITPQEIETGRAALSNVVSRLRSRGVPVFVMLYANPYPTDWKKFLATMAINAAIASACPAGTQYIHSSCALNDSACWANGDYHPSFEGHVRLANYISQTLAH